MNKLINLRFIATIQNTKSIHTTVCRFLDQDWRQTNRLAMNPNAEGPLTNLPDFTYMDGRPTPLGRRQKRRVIFQRELAQKIVSGSSEIDYAIDRHSKLQEEKVKEKQKIRDNMLRPKGHLLLKKK